ncbi:MAG: CAP domain-containing protein [Bacillota bacterium]
MNYKKILIAIVAVLVLVSLLPVDTADAASYRYYKTYDNYYVTQYKIHYYYSPSGTVYRIYYNYPQYKEPVPAEPTKPSQPAEPTQPAVPKNPVPSQPGQNVGQASQYEVRVVELVNQERSKAGLAPLQWDASLANVARLKSQDMRDNRYFSHTSPTYGSPFDMMKKFGISYRYAGENIAAGQRTPEEVVRAWMNSPGHKANILNDKYTHIGVGYASGGSYGAYWTQMFIGK